MSNYGPPSDEQVRSYYSSQSRTANWVFSHSPPPSRSSSRPPTLRSSSQSSSSRPSSRATSRPRGNSLPPPPPGFKYAPASTPMVYKTQAATYTVITTNAKNVIVTSPDGGRPSKHRHSHSTSSAHLPLRQQTFPQTSPKHSSAHNSSGHRHHSSHHSSHHSPSKTKEKPLLQRLFSLGSSKGRQRSNSTGGSGSGFNVKW